MSLVCPNRCPGCEARAGAHRQLSGTRSATILSPETVSLCLQKEDEQPRRLTSVPSLPSQTTSDETHRPGRGWGFCEMPRGRASHGSLRTDSSRLVAEGDHLPQPAPLTSGFTDRASCLEGTRRGLPCRVDAWPRGECTGRLPGPTAALRRISEREGAPPPLPRSRAERAQDGSFPPAAPALPAPQPAPNLRCGQGLPRRLCWCAPQTQKTADSASSRGSSGRASDLGYGGQKPGLHLGAAQGSHEEKPPQKGPPGASEWGSGTDGGALGKAQEFPECTCGSCPTAHHPPPPARPAPRTPG
ncbi:uncharacterized protein LOC105311643 [Pteropus vampyrus]|uniref:Uncharacterized protein LOC105311643 n=1 Tax=Pteropus vampyrus TaxID=132908 RepID=A0A6P6C712_PTEVA|nr:uncharacterized protein LOC105311643 [Pteropus vampyrus]